MFEILNGTFPVLSLLIALPALAGVLVLAVKPLRIAGRWIALSVSTLEIVLALSAAFMIDWSAKATYQLAETYTWIPQLGISWALGVTQLSLAMILLAVALVPIVLLAAWNEDAENAREGKAGKYAALILILEAFMVLIFSARDVAVFYFAFVSHANSAVLHDRQLRA